jgi:hypothetical protein
MASGKNRARYEAVSSENPEDLGRRGPEDSQAARRRKFEGETGKV